MFEPDAILIGFFVGNDTYDPINRVEQLPTAVRGRRVTREAASGKFIQFKIFRYEQSHIARLVIGKSRLPWILQEITARISRRNILTFNVQG